jgi:hypothetical protein
MFTADDIAALARRYEAVPRGAADTAARLREIEDRLLDGDPLTVAVRCVRMHQYLCPPWIADAFLRSLEARADAR